MTNLRPSLKLFTPLSANANATITVVAARVWAIDPTTGNLTADDGVEVSVRAILKSGITSGLSGIDINQFPGIDQKNSLLFGYIVDPKFDPEGVDHNTEATIEFDNVNLETDPRAGKCRLWIPVQNPFVKGDLGVKLLVELVEDK